MIMLCALPANDGRAIFAVFASGVTDKFHAAPGADLFSADITFQLFCALWAVPAFVLVGQVNFSTVFADALTHGRLLSVLVPPGRRWLNFLDVSDSYIIGLCEAEELEFRWIHEFDYPKVAHFIDYF